MSAVMVLLQSFDPGAQKRLHKLPLKDQERRQKRKDHHHGCRRDDRDINAVLGRAEDREPHRQRSRGVGVRHDQRPEKVVPMCRHRHQCVRDIGWPRRRNVDMPQHAQQAASFDARHLVQLLWHRFEGCSLLGVLWHVYIPAARPTYIAYALVSVATHWNNFLWPLIVTNSDTTRPLTVGLSIFGAPENGVDISVISAATVMVILPLLSAFLIFQRQFVQAFLRAGIK